VRKQSFGQKLIGIRKSKGLTQQNVAEMCQVTVRTVQRIESGMVIPRASTIKLIAETLGFEFFETSLDSRPERPNLKIVMNHFKNLFNLKTHTMKKISILSVTVFGLVFLCINMFKVEAQSENPQTKKSLVIEFNSDRSLSKVAAAFTPEMNFDSLVKMKVDLRSLSIQLDYKKIEFNDDHKLSYVECWVKCDGEDYNGAFGIDLTTWENREERFGFYRDYSKNAKYPFGTGLIDKLPSKSE